MIETRIRTEVRIRASALAPVHLVQPPNGQTIPINKYHNYVVVKMLISSVFTQNIQN